MSKEEITYINDMLEEVIADMYWITKTKGPRKEEDNRTLGNLARLKDQLLRRKKAIKKEFESSTCSAEYIRQRPKWQMKLHLSHSALERLKLKK